ncbi:hypothetical protein H6P81_016588 [Aristolochia fimbriata]|uniref:Uncharacterized protein n=1 Tax=Aristolochia fimbriata TaxID=158543 RepID=A0AAV7EDC6_ARIFI|nr:hypothetical protein H6P81_016588 [Aristolochia fimbriata]
MYPRVFNSLLSTELLLQSPHPPHCDSSFYFPHFPAVCIFSNLSLLHRAGRRVSRDNLRGSACALVPKD